MSIIGLLWTSCCSSARTSHDGNQEVTLRIYFVSAWEQSGSASFDSPREGLASPLAKRLFGIDGVSGVFFGSDFITVTKGEDAPWNTLKPEVFAAIMEHFTSGVAPGICPCTPGNGTSRTGQGTPCGDFHQDIVMDYLLSKSACDCLFLVTQDMSVLTCRLLPGQTQRYESQGAQDGCLAAWHKTLAGLILTCCMCCQNRRPAIHG